MEMNEKTLPKVILRFQGNELQLVTPFVNNYHLSRKKNIYLGFAYGAKIYLSELKFFFDRSWSEREEE